MNVDHEEIYNALSDENRKRIFNYEECELSSDFLGFLENYADLTDKIPKKFAIIDIGCNQAVQAYYFKDFEYYIGIDDTIPAHNRFEDFNTVHVQFDASDLIRLDTIIRLLDPKKAFVIMSGVIDTDDKIKKYILDECFYYRIIFPGTETIEKLPEVR